MKMKASAKKKIRCIWFYNIVCYPNASFIKPMYKAIICKFRLY